MPPLTNRERRSLLMVAFVILLSALVQWMRPHITRTKQFDYTLQDSLFKALSADTANADTRVKEPFSAGPRSKSPKQKRHKTKKKILTPKSINPNTASAKELELLPHIGPKTAQAIVRYRQEHGPFKSIDELDNVKRIGPKTIERIRPFLILSGQHSQADSSRKGK